MRLARLGLAAYGPFADFELDFSGSAQVELVFGVNEAGKSTALRAVRGLLFGIPEQTGDAHRHPASELSIEASVLDDAGKALFMRRRRRRKESLRDQADEPLPEDTLANLLGGVDAAAFERLFGFDHERLAQASEEMLKGKGDVGEALFAAGAGSSAVGAVLRELEREASEIFTPLARTRPLNTLIKDYRTLQSELRRERLLPEAYLQQREKIDAAERELERIRGERLRLGTELAKLTRVERALPWLGKFERARSELAGQALPSLSPSDVSERRSSAERERDDARIELRHLATEHALESERLTRIGPIPKLIEVAESTLLELLGALNTTRGARLELPERRAELSLLMSEALELSQKYGLATTPEAALSLALGAEAIARAERLLVEHGRLAREAHHLQRRRAEIAARAELREAREPGVASERLSDLERAIEAARGARDFAERERECEQSLQKLERESLAARARLQPAPALASPIADWHLPSDETLERLARDLNQLEFDARRLAERDEQAAQRENQAQREIERIERAFAPPSEQDLADARATRDALLTEAWLVRGAAQPGLPHNVVAALGRADELADRLRREAARVNELSTLRAEVTALARERADVAAQRASLLTARAALWVEHRAAFQAVGIEPLPPAEMRGWLARQREAARAEQALLEARERRRLLDAERARLCSLLEGALPEAASGEREPASLLRRAERWVESARSEQKAQLAAERALGSARAELAGVDVELGLHARSVTELRERDRAAQSALGLPAALPPEELRQALDGLTSLHDRLEKHARVRLQIDALERRVQAFDAEVLRLSQLYAPDLASLPAESALPALHARQREAVSHAREQRSLDEKLTELEQRRSDSQRKLGDAEATLSELAQSLGLASPEELPAWEVRAARVRALSEQLNEAERELAALAEGRSPSALAEEAAPFASDEIGPRKREIAEELEHLEQAAYQARREAEGLQAGLLLFEGQRAADAAQRLSEVGAAIRERARHYAELRVAQGILSRQLAEFREKHQGPILERASALFARLTLGSFRGLRVGLDAAVLECVRSSGQGLAVTELSEGVRYQLYFALRLASLERYLERGSALPLVLDDVFIHWDDERAEAGFRVLGELSQRTQVLFFTHHAHLADVAARALGPRLRRHALPAPERAA
ncbi:MAG: AAA family ATPase [Polyangiaceae bacterium]